MAETPSMPAMTASVDCGSKRVSMVTQRSKNPASSRNWINSKGRSVGMPIHSKAATRILVSPSTAINTGTDSIAATCAWPPVTMCAARTTRFPVMCAVKSPESARKLMTSVLPAITLSMPGIKLRMRELPTYGTGTGMPTLGSIMVRQEVATSSPKPGTNIASTEQAYTWSKGKAIYAAGVQFPPVRLNGQTFLPGQANNFYIFPAIGMAVFATQASRVPDELFIEAGQAVADQVPSDLLNQGLLYPLQSNILETEIQTAARVAKLVFDSGLARVQRPADMVAFIRGHVYKPEYCEEAIPPTKAA